jgi:hypothetical protein
MDILWLQVRERWSALCFESRDISIGRFLSILLAGAAFTGVTVFLQAVLRSYFDTTA